MSSRIDNLISLIFKTGRIVREGVKQRERINPFSVLQLETLQYVADHHNPTMNDIARYLSITPPSATSLITAVVRDGYLERLHDKTDRRKVRLALTSRGRRAIDHGVRQMSAQMRGVFEHLSTKEQKDLMHILDKLSKIYHK